MSDIIERAEEWLNRHDYESRAFTGTYAVISSLVAALKAARAENERLRGQHQYAQTPLGPLGIQFVEDEVDD